MVSLPDTQTSFTLQLVTSLVMTGIVLITQFISYPIYVFLPKVLVAEYQAEYMLRAFFIIGPIMLIEMITAIQLTRDVHNHDLHRSLRSNITVLGIIWGITFLFELPAHLSILNSGFSSLAYRTVLWGNIFRVLLWVLKSKILINMIPHMYLGKEVYTREFL